MDKIIFEIITPPETWAPEKVDEWAERICDILKRHSLRYLNIPEVVNETRDGERKVRYIPKMDNVKFAEILGRHCPNAVPVLNKVCVRITRRQFEDWVSGVYEKGSRNLIIVGGELPDYPYPGYPVTEAVAWIKSRYQDLKVGGITIFTRPHEAERISAKIKQGIDFFVSQIIFETANLKHVLIELERLTSAQGFRMPEMHISLAPASQIRDIEFMQWLGVEFPSAILAYLARDEEGVEERTFEMVERVQEEIFDFTKNKNYKLGFNVEHVIYTNLGLSEKLVDEITERMGR